MFWTLHKWNYFGSALPWPLGVTSICLWIAVNPETTSLRPHLASMISRSVNYSAATDKSIHGGMSLDFME